ncbi:hypothetical protein N7474_007481 [Penicillium riverlandense]|uniref:uncharacterized protein n=1 Tax=Penicillium riverlandense TaxID=1903569 RepID=UPI002547F636|nr:uncharacterized protein N7474_007481 [Penicillium riverlandense]KAJ5815704.1 hypothetical protein N7474_007481 [Penicillium riverlandense]
MPDFTTLASHDPRYPAPNKFLPAVHTAVGNILHATGLEELIMKTMQNTRRQWQPRSREGRAHRCTFHRPTRKSILVILGPGNPARKIDHIASPTTDRVIETKQPDDKKKTRTRDTRCGGAIDLAACVDFDEVDDVSRRFAMLALEDKRGRSPKRGQQKTNAWLSWVFLWSSARLRCLQRKKTEALKLGLPSEPGQDDEEDKQEADPMEIQATGF